MTAIAGGARPRFRLFSRKLGWRLAGASIGFVELRVQCEQKFNVQINDDDYTPENFTSIRLLANLIDRLQSARKAAAPTV